MSYGLYLWHWPLYVVLTPERTHLGHAAVTALRAQVEGSPDTPHKREYNIHTELVIRESTGAPRTAPKPLGKPK